MTFLLVLQHVWCQSQQNGEHIPLLSIVSSSVFQYSEHV